MTARETFGNIVALIVSAALIVATILAINVRLAGAAYDIEDDSPHLARDVEFSEAGVQRDEIENDGPRFGRDVEFSDAGLQRDEADDSGSFWERVIEFSDAGLQRDVDDSFEAPTPCSGYTLARVEALEPGDAPCETEDELAKHNMPYNDEIADEQPFDGDCVEVELVHFEYAEAAGEPAPCGSYSLSL